MAARTTPTRPPANPGIVDSGFASGSLIVGRPSWSGGSVNGLSMLGTTRQGGDVDYAGNSGAGGGGYGGGGAGHNSGGGGVCGSFALANTASGTDVGLERQGSYVVFLFVTD